MRAPKRHLVRRTGFATASCLAVGVAGALQMLVERLGALGWLQISRTSNSRPVHAGTLGHSSLRVRQLNCRNTAPRPETPTFFFSHAPLFRPLPCSSHQPAARLVPLIGLALQPSDLCCAALISPPAALSSAIGCASVTALRCPRLLFTPHCDRSPQCRIRAGRRHGPEQAAFELMCICREVPLFCKGTNEALHHRHGFGHISPSTQS